MRTVGLLLVSALMVVPVATSQQLPAVVPHHRSAPRCVVGVLASVGGLLLSAYVSVSHDVAVATGPRSCCWPCRLRRVTWPVGAWLRHRDRLRAPFPGPVPDEHLVTDEHPHEHGPDCGHVAVPHGDHVDYVHGGHRHAPHGAHYDEH